MKHDPEMQQLPRPGARERRVGDVPTPEWVKGMKTADVERRILVAIGYDQLEARLWSDFMGEF